MPLLFRHQSSILNGNLLAFPQQTENPSLFCSSFFCLYGLLYFFVISQPLSNFIVTKLDWTVGHVETNVYKSNLYNLWHLSLFVLCPWRIPRIIAYSNIGLSYPAPILHGNSVVDILIPRGANGSQLTQLNPNNELFITCVVKSALV